MQIHHNLTHLKEGISQTEELLTELQDYSLLTLFLDELNYLKTKLPTSYRIFTKEELLYDYNGQNGKPLYLATCNYVFDVTHHPLWHLETYPTLQLGLSPLDYFQLYYQNDLKAAAEAGPIIGKFLTY